MKRWPRTVRRPHNVQFRVVRFGNGAAISGHPRWQGVGGGFVVRMPGGEHRLSETEGACLAL